MGQGVLLPLFYNLVVEVEASSICQGREVKSTEITKRNKRLPVYK
jgi:hypothetical protein